MWTLDEGIHLLPSTFVASARDLRPLSRSRVTEARVMIRVESALRQLFRRHLLSHIWRRLIGRHHFLPVRYISRHVRSGITRQLRRQLELVGRRHLLLLTCIEWMRAVAHLGSGRRGIRLRRRHFGRDFVRMRLFDIGSSLQMREASLIVAKFNALPTRSDV